MVDGTFDGLTPAGRLLYVTGNKREDAMGQSAAERQAAYKARHGRQLSVPLSPAAWSRLEELGREWACAAERNRKAA
jgi:hypothetical protein